MKKEFPTEYTGYTKDYKYFMRHDGYGTNSRYTIFFNKYSGESIAQIYKKDMALKLLGFLNGEEYK